MIPKAVPLNPPSYVVVPNAYASQDEVLMGQPLDLNLHNPDRYALELGNSVLGGNGFASRLMVDIRVKHGFAYGTSLGMGSERSLFYVQYGSDSTKLAPVDALVTQNLSAIQNTAVTGPELTNARQYEIRSVPVQGSSVNHIASSLLSRSWHGEPLDQPTVAAKHDLTLTPDQVQGAFKKYLKPQHLTQVVQGTAPAQH